MLGMRNHCLILHRFFPFTKKMLPQLSEDQSWLENGDTVVMFSKLGPDPLRSDSYILSNHCSSGREFSYFIFLRSCFDYCNYMWFTKWPLLIVLWTVTRTLLRDSQGLCNLAKPHKLGSQLPFIYTNVCNGIDPQNIWEIGNVFRLWTLLLVLARTRQNIQNSHISTFDFGKTYTHRHPVNK